jgi:uracil-DNA glycosylase family 4
MNTQEKTLKIELPFDKCNQCSLRFNNIKYEGLDRDISWGEWDDHIEIIFISDKGTNPGFGYILSYKEKAGSQLYEIIKENNIKNFLITSVTLCRHSDGDSPSLNEMMNCSNNLEIILQTVIKMNKSKNKKPPIIVIFGATAANRFFPNEKKKNLKITKLRTERYEYENCPLFITYHPASFKENENFKTLATQDIIAAYNYYQNSSTDSENDYILIENIEE